MGVLQHRRLSVFRDQPEVKIPPAQTGPLRDFGQILVLKTPITELLSSSDVLLTVRVTNPTRNTWPQRGDTSGSFAVKLSYHWLSADLKMVVYEGNRAALPRDLAPGASVDLTARVTTPQDAGRYLLQLSMVQEKVAWFAERKSPPLDTWITVVSSD
jgi:hypothetical protein